MSNPTRYTRDQDEHMFGARRRTTENEVVENNNIMNGMFNEVLNYEKKYVV